MGRSSWWTCVVGLLMVLAAGGAEAEQITGEALLRAGPMPGYSALRSVRIWLQASRPAVVALEYWPKGRRTEARRTGREAVDGATDYVAQFDVDDLEPGSIYEYRVWVDDATVEASPPWHFHTQALWQWRSDPPPFKVAAGSCTYFNEPAYDRPGKSYGAGEGIFDAIAAQEPDFMLWLGDNLYFREVDYASAGGMAYRYRRDRAAAPLQRLLHGTHHYAIWDDHDYGADDADSSFIFKWQSLALFRRYWANPSYGLPGVAGNFTRLGYQDVDFYLLDDRWYRNNERAPATPAKAMLGDSQMAWLRDALLGSHATFKVIVDGSRMLSGQGESWTHYPAERQAFLDWLGVAGIDGVLFLSGGSHVSALVKLPRPGSYPLYELTCSPLTAEPAATRGQQDDPLLVPGTLVAERNFCTLEVSGPAQARQLDLKVHDNSGGVLWQHRLSAAALHGE
jgi:alkaline phosphatase D